MRIAFDAKRLFHNRTGLGNYSRSLVANIGALNQENEIYLFTPSTNNTVFPEFETQRYSICDGKGRFLWRLKNMVKDIEKLKIDIYHGLSNELPVGISKLKHTKTVVTIHDLIFLRFPDYYPKVDRIIYHEKSKRACKRADHIIAVSEATKEDIIKFYGTDPDKISVIYQAYDDFFSSVTSGKQDIGSKERSFILYVGSVTERKNLQNLLLALHAISKNDRPKLRVVGRGGAYEKKMRSMVQQLELGKDVEFLGQVNNRELKVLYEEANCLVYPSFYEGFGIPIIEALVCGTPVVTSNVSSMPEAAFGLGHLVNPHSVEELKLAIESCLSTPKRLKSDEIDLVRRKYNPVRHAKEVLKLYKELLKR